MIDFLRTFSRNVSENNIYPQQQISIDLKCILSAINKFWYFVKYFHVQPFGFTVSKQVLMYWIRFFNKITKMIYPLIDYYHQKKKTNKHCLLNKHKCCGNDGWKINWKKEKRKLCSTAFLRYILSIENRTRFALYKEFWIQFQSVEKKKKKNCEVEN